MAMPLSRLSDMWTGARAASTGQDLANRASQLYKGARESSILPFALVAVSGFALGLITGILIAPASGYETRHRVSDRASEMASSARDMAMRRSREMREEAEEIAS